MQEGLLPDCCRGEKHSEVRVAASTWASWLIRRHWKKKKKKRQPYLWRCKKSTQQLPLYETVHSPSTHHSAPLVSFTIWNLSKLGQPKCLSVCSIYFTRTLGWGPNLHPIQGNLEPLILFCSALAGSCTQCTSRYPREADVLYCKVWKVLFYVDSCFKCVAIVTDGTQHWPVNSLFVHFTGSHYW